jgi:hypothetical protein
MRGPVVSWRVRCFPCTFASDWTEPEDTSPATFLIITWGPALFFWNFMSYSPAPKSAWIWMPRHVPMRMSGVSAEQVVEQVEFCWQVLPWQRPFWQKEPLQSESLEQ